MKKLMVSMMLFCGIVMAGEQSNRIDTREQNQKARIVEGVASGELTKHEARKLAVAQHHVKKVEARAKADGYLSANERLQIEAAQDRQSAKINAQKHDEQERK